MTQRWSFWVDRGGTFTDIVARDPAGSLVSYKLLSHNPERYADATTAGVRRLLGLADDQPIPKERVEVVKMGTTVATNALLESAGEPTVLVITRGFGDALRIAYQNRPRIFERRIEQPQLLYSRVIEVVERVDANGEVRTPLDVGTVRRQLHRAYDDGFRAVAIVCVHGYRYPAHERIIGDVAREIGFPQVSESHHVSPLMKVVARGDTSVVDAYLSPVLRRYVDDLSAELADPVSDAPGRRRAPGTRLPGECAEKRTETTPRMMFMQSHGGLTEAHHFRGKDSILSGPAGGIVGMARTSKLAGFDKVIGFDMGGTSTDVSHYAGGLERVMQAEIAGVRVRAPMLAIHTVAAGGGSVLHFDGSKYRVGPDSAGADPGPACYRRGGPLTLTDANLMLGRIQPDHFPHVFGPGGDQPLDADVVRERFDALAKEIEDATGTPTTPEEAAAGFREIAVENMANAIKKISVQRGRDITEYALTTFGGAGGQHACAVADALSMAGVLVPPFAGVLSAYGMGLADTTSMREQALDVPLDDAAPPKIAELAAALEREAHAELRDEGVEERRINAVHRVHVRYQGTDTSIAVTRGTLPEMVSRFEEAYRQQYSFLMRDKPLVAEAVSVEVVGAADPPDRHVLELPACDGALTELDIVRMFGAGQWVDAPLYRREDARPGDTVEGPAIIAEAGGTTIIEPGWRALVTDTDHLRLDRVVARPTRHDIGTESDPVLLEIFGNLFMAVAEQMGVRLENTAQSVNIKERLDFSCALFDPEGNLVANAPHMPVHLGSMGESIKTVIARSAGIMKPGDVYALNDPYHGGTHLPDITVVTPVFDEQGRDLLFYVASRGHHAEIGGLTPGSMPPFSTSIEEEGVLFDNWLLVENGRMREAETRRLLASASYPSRDPETNLADLRAQIAANEKGVQEVRAMIGHFGLDVVQAYMRHVQDNAERSVRRVVSTLRDGHYRYEHDDGFVIEVRVAIDRDARSAVVDFTGTSPQLAGNFNAPRSVARAAALYVFRTLVEGDIPLNDGCLKPITITIPDGTLLSPEYPAATVAGNVETSQAVTGALYAALGVQAEGSGTMNNVTFGNDRVQYYETVGSGSGAGDGFAGADVVQTHMTNSRLTDPEVLEWRYPVLLESFAIRHGSGGVGRWRGGDGGTRRIRFLEPVTVSMLSAHRRVPPYGMAGGEAGQLGRNRVERTDGSVTELSGSDSTEAGTGDVLVIETPGGGGYGRAEAGGS